MDRKKYGRYALDATNVVLPRPKPIQNIPTSQLRQLAPNKVPIEWQLDDLVDKYNRTHNRVKSAWDRYVISPETVTESNQWWENLGIDNPKLIPLAAIGSTLSGEMYDVYRDIQTDPANLVGGELLTGGKKIKSSIGVIGKTKPRKYPKEAFITTMDDIEDLVSKRDKSLNTMGLKSRLSASEFHKDINKNLLRSDIDPNLATLNKTDGYYPTKDLINQPGTGVLIDYSSSRGIQPFNVERQIPWTQDEIKRNILFNGHIPLDANDLDVPIFRGHRLSKDNTNSIPRGGFGKDNATGSVENTHWYGPGIYATPDISEAADYARVGFKDWYNRYKADPNTGYERFFTSRVLTPKTSNFDNVLESYRTFSTTPSIQMRQKLLALFGDDIATNPVLRNTPIHNLLSHPNAHNAHDLYDELIDLDIQNINHKQMGSSYDTPRNVIVGDFSFLPVVGHKQSENAKDIAASWVVDNKLLDNPIMREIEDIDEVLHSPDHILSNNELRKIIKR